MTSTPPPERDYLILKTPLRVIVEETAAKHGLTLAAFLGQRKSANVAHARQEGYARATEETGASLKEIALAFKRGHHTTILKGARAHLQRVSRETEVTKVTGAVNGADL